MTIHRDESVHALLQRFVWHVRTHLHENITTEALTHALSTTSQRLNQIVKEEFGVTVSTYI